MKEITRHNQVVRGKLIVFEGIDGAGKATQVGLLAKYLREKGEHVAVFSIPRYKTPVGRIIKKALHGEYGDFRNLDPHLSSMPYFMDYAVAKESFLKELKKGIVIFDRYVESTFAYHGAKLSGRAQRELIRNLSVIAYREIGLPKPNVVFLLDVPVSEAQKLIAKKKKDQNEKDTNYQEKVAAVYRVLARGKNWRTIHCVRGGKLLSRGEISVLVRKTVSR